MCLLVVKPAGVAPVREHYEAAFDYNKDGAGFAYWNEGRVHVSKGYFTFDSFWEKAQLLKDYPALVHFRMTTHGATNHDNCHPFDVGAIHGRREYAGDLVMAHNGVLSIKTPVQNMSDTWHYVRDHLYPMWKRNPRFIEEPGITEAIGKAIGHNKFAFLDRDGLHHIVNEDLGHWHENGHWYSNDSYEDQWSKWETARAVYQCEQCGSWNVYTPGQPRCWACRESDLKVPLWTQGYAQELADLGMSWEDIYEEFETGGAFYLMSLRDRLVKDGTVSLEA